MTPVGALCRTLYAPRTFSERCHRNHCRSGLALTPARRAMRRTKPHLDVSLHSSEPASAAVTPELYSTLKGRQRPSSLSSARLDPTQVHFSSRGKAIALLGLETLCHGCGTDSRCQQDNGGTSTASWSKRDCDDCSQKAFRQWHVCCRDTSMSRGGSQKGWPGLFLRAAQAGLATGKVQREQWGTSG